MTKQKALNNLASKLQKYTPNPEVAKTFALWIMDLGISLKVTPERSSKLGDYRSPRKGKGHQITINGTLNPYAFTITFIHEVAHLHTWMKHSHRVEAHGVEWKMEFQELMLPFLEPNKVFPNDILHPLLQYMKDPAAATCRDERLIRALMAYDPITEPGLVHLSDLPNGSWFLDKQGQQFKKLRLLQKNIRCEQYQTGRLYNVAPYILVKPIDPPSNHHPEEARNSRIEQWKESVQEAGYTYLSEIPMKAIFHDNKGRIYRKVRKLRVNFECQEMHSGRLYRIGPDYPVRLMKR